MGGADLARNGFFALDGGYGFLLFWLLPLWVASDQTRRLEEGLVVLVGVRVGLRLVDGAVGMLGRRVDREQP